MLRGTTRPPFDNSFQLSPRLHTFYTLRSVLCPLYERIHNRLYERLGFIEVACFNV